MIKVSSNDILASPVGQKRVYIDIAKSIAEHGTRLLWGQGFEYVDTNKERERAVIELFVNNKMGELFKAMSNTMSLYGRCLLVIDFIGNKPKLHIADPNFNCKVGKAWANETGAVYWYRPIQDDFNYAVKVTCTMNKNTYQAFDNGNEMRLDVLNEVLPPELRIPTEWVHNLGFIPAVQMTNKALFSSSIQTYEYHQLADCFNVRDLLPAINYQIEELIMEAGMSHTRAYGNFDVNTLKEMKKQRTTPERAILDRIFINQGALDSKANIAIQQSNFDGETRWAVIDKLLNKVMFESGYSPIDDSVQQTATEVLFTKSRDIETTKQKRNMMQVFISEVLRKCFVIMGYYTKEQYEVTKTLDDETWSFEIKENMVLNPIALSAELYQMYQNDQISYYEMIAKLRDIPVAEARTIAEEILKDNNEIKAEQMSAMMPVVGPQEGGNYENKPDEIKKTDTE